MPVYAVRETATDGSTFVRIIDSDQQSWDELAQLSQRRPDDCAQVFWSRIGAKSGGLLYPVVVSHRPKIGPFGKAFSSDDVQRTHAALVDWLDSFGATRPSELLRRADTWSIWWPGVFYNVVFLLAAGVAVWSWGWIFEVDSWRHQRRRDRGLCGECAYDLAATKMDGTGSLLCPECGTLNRPNKVPPTHG